MYRYDVAGQLVQTTDMRYGTTQYQYDTAGNLIRETNGADVTDYRYNKLNQLVSKTTPEGSFVYEYDKRGNLITEKQDGTALYTYEYDATNRMLMGVNVSTDESSEYIYNGLGMRTANIQTTQNASYGSRNTSNSQGSELIGHMDFFALVDRPVDVQKTFTDNFGLTRQSKPAIINREYVVDYTNMYNRDLMVYEEGSYVTSYTYGRGLNKISQTTSHYPGKTEPGIEGQNSYTDLAVEKYSKLYLHQNRLGSTIRITRENGTTIAWADYDEWGKPRSPIDFDMNMAGIDNAIGFTSYTYDVVLDKFFAQTRIYDASNRRFTQIDPIKDGLNWYTYVGNNPTRFIDPLGLEKVLLREIIEKNGGTVTTTQRTIFGIDCGLKSVTVTIGDNEKTYTGSDYKIVNGKAVIDNEVLMADFGLTRNQSIHLAGDKFETRDLVAFAFGLMYHQKSKDEEQEYGAAIDRDANDKYSFTNVMNSSMFAVDPNNMTEKERNRVGIKYTANSVGDIHTHWRPDGNLNFSNPEDYSGNSQGIKFMYLVNRKGEVYYSPRTFSNNNIDGFAPGKKIFKIK